MASATPHKKVGGAWLTGSPCVARSLEDLQRVSGCQIQPNHAHLGAAGSTYRLDQLTVAAAEATAPVRTTERITGVNPLTRLHAVAPVQVSCAVW